MIYVQFSDASETKIVSVFSCSQDPATYPNQGEVTADDVRYISYYDSQSSIVRHSLPQPLI